MSYEQLDQKAVMLGGHEARLDNLEAGQKVIAEDVKIILGYMERSKGSWKTLVAISGIIATVVEIFHQLGGFLHGK